MRSIKFGLSEKNGYEQSVLADGPAGGAATAHIVGRVIGKG